MNYAQLSNVLFWVLLTLMVLTFGSTYPCLIFIKDKDKAAKWAWRLVYVGIGLFAVLAFLF